MLLKLQTEYANWLAALPEGLHDNPSAQVLEDIVNLDLDSLARRSCRGDTDATERSIMDDQ